jgi:hypothetical protein
MKMHRGTVILVVLMAVSCSGFTTRTEINKSGLVEKIKNAGIVLRVQRSGSITLDDYTKNLTFWLSASTSVRKLAMVQNPTDGMSAFTADDDRFFQVAEGDDYLKFKSLGVVNNYLRINEGDLKKAIEQGGYDGLVLYEVYGVISTEMQFISFDTVMVITDKNLNVLYLDHQTNTFESNEMDRDRMKRHLLDKVSNRLIGTMEKNGFIKK